MNIYWEPINTRHSAGNFTNKTFNLHNSAMYLSVYWLYWTVPSQIHVHPEPMNVILFWNRFPVDIIKLHWIRVDFNPLIGIFIDINRGKSGHRRTRIETQGDSMWQWRNRLKWCVYKAKCTKGGLNLPEARRSKEGYFPRASGGRWPCWHLDLSLVSQTVRE